jgi:hypothetical protein
MLARGGPTLIRSVKVDLEKLDGARKTFPLVVEQFGTLLPKGGQTLFEEHNYLGKSVLYFLAADKPERFVYFCLHQTQRYINDQVQAVSDFEADARQLQAADLPSIASPAEIAKQQQLLLTSLVDKHLPRMMGLLQIESGDFIISITVVYESTRARFRRWRKPKTSTSTIGFSFPPSFRMTLQQELRSTLLVRAAFLGYGINEPLQYPTISPVDFVER